LAETCSYFLLLNTIINPYYHSCVFMTDIYLTISLSTHIGDDTPQKKQMGFRSEDWTQQVRDTFRWLAFVKAVMNPGYRQILLVTFFSDETY